MTGVDDVATDKKYIAVKVETEIIRQARAICGYRDKTLAAFLSDLLRPVVAREYEKFRRDVAHEKPKD